jgi:hypothetical protein
VSYSATILADTPTAYYRLGEASGTTMTDSSGNARDGSYSSVTLGVTGLLVGDPDTAVTYSGATSSHGDVTWAAWMNTAAETVECWIETTTASGVQLLICRDSLGQRNYQFRLNGSNLEFITINGGAGVVTAAQAVSVSDGVPHHLVATYDASNIKLYVDGALVNTTAAVGGLSGGGCNLMIGNFPSPGLGFFGTMDEVALYGYALTGTQIAAHYVAGTTASGTPATATGAVAFTGSGAAAASASASGTLTFTGTTTARAAGTATGSIVFAGTATPGASGAATATGSLTFTGTATGRAPAAAVGTAAFTGTASAGAAATASGTLTFTGSATGATAGAATATGTVAFAGTGTARAAASSAGTITYTGTSTARGVATAAGAVTFTGLGTSISGYKDLRLITAAAPSNWITAEAPSNWTTKPGAPNWTMTEAT